MGATLRQNDELDVTYDRAADVLYLSIGNPAPALTKGAENGLLIRFDPATNRVVGVTVLNYEEKFRGLDDMSWLDSKALPSQLTEYLKRRPHFT